jgi:hypothetical protein
VLDEAKEEEDDAGLEEWSFVRMAALIASNSDAESDDDLCPSLLARTSPSDKLRNDGDDSMPKLVGRNYYESDSDAEVDKNGDSISVGLTMGNDLDSDSDDESKNENWESEYDNSDDNSMPDLLFQAHCYDSDSDAESKVGEDEAACNLSEDTDISLDSSKAMVKWLLDTGGSIHADANGKNVNDERKKMSRTRNPAMNPLGLTLLMATPLLQGASEER